MLFISTNLKAELAMVVSDELQLMKDWFGVNRLSLNLEISYFFNFHTPKASNTYDSRTEIVIDEVTMKQATNTNFLGMRLVMN